MPEFEFASDWRSGNLYLFEPNLPHLRGKPCRLPAIGSFDGRSAVWLLGNIATDPQSRIDCVDDAVRPTLQRNIALADKQSKITLHKGKSGDVLTGLPTASFDFIYVDGSHRKIYVLEDSVLAFRLAKPGAIIGFDDYTLREPARGDRALPSDLDAQALSCGA